MENNTLYSITHELGALLRHNGKLHGAKQPIKSILQRTEVEY